MLSILHRIQLMFRLIYIPPAVIQVLLYTRLVPDTLAIVLSLGSIKRVLVSLHDIWYVIWTVTQYKRAIMSTHRYRI